MGSSSYGEMVMCPPESSSGRSRRGGKTKAAEQKANKQPQRGLGVAQLEKIRLHNQMMAAYQRSGGMHQLDAGRMQVPFAATTTPFQPSYQAADCGFETTGRGGILGVHYYDNLLPYSSSSSSSPPPPLFAHDLRDSSGHRLGHPPPQQQRYCWVTTTTSDGSSSAEELDLELRL